MNVKNISTSIEISADIEDRLSVIMEYSKHYSEIHYKLREQVYRFNECKGWQDVSPVSAKYVLEVFKQTDRHKQMVNVIMEAVKKQY